MDDFTEKTLSNFVETQFPEFYLTDGPTFILFVKKYYEWLEGSQEVAVPFTKGTVSFTSANSVVTGKNTFFVDQFDDGDKIGLFYDDTDENYEIFTIASVDSDTQLTLDTDALPSYSANNALYGAVKVEYNANYHIRRLNDYSDVDQTTADFILFFKEKYLKNIQFTTKTNTRQLIKHSLDLYRSKGTIRGLQLLFRLVFGTSVNVYYPGTDVFKPSDGEWFVPRYLEVSLKDGTTSFVNKQITGLTSGATAFVESVVRRTVKGKFIDIVYVSSINGNFITDEIINTTVVPLDIEDCPFVIGSLTSIDVSSTGTGAFYAVGDEVQVSSDKGEQGKALVANISNITGVVDFELIDGGYGYTTNAEIAISERVLVVNNTILDANNRSLNYFDFGENVYQPMANISYVNGAGGQFANDAAVYTYYANNSLAGNGYILVASPANNTTGSLLVALNSGNLNVSYIGLLSNTIHANISGYTDKTAVGNVVGYYSNCTIKTSGAPNTTWAVGENVYQLDANTLSDSANGVILRNILEFGANSFVTLVNCHGAFDVSKPLLLRSNSSVSADPMELTIYLGVKDITNDFFSYHGNRIYGNNELTTGNVTIISTGTGASFELSNSFNYTEDLEVNVDLLADFAGVALNATAYGLSGNAAANASSIIGDAVGFENFTFGKLTAIKGAALGSNYNLPPIVRVYEQSSAEFKLKDKILNITGASGLFKTGELVTQSAVASRGLVSFANSSVVQVELLRVDPDNGFVETSNSTTVLVGSDTGFTANVTLVYDNIDSEFIGINADIETDTRTANGAIVDLSVFDSGFGFREGEIVQLTSESNENSGVGHARLGSGVGKSRGFWRRKGGFPSDTKYIFDGLYYQDYSYEIRSSLTLDKYEDMLKKIMHIPGTKYFGAFVHGSINEVPIMAHSTTVSQS